MLFNVLVIDNLTDKVVERYEAVARTEYAAEMVERRIQSTLDLSKHYTVLIESD